MLVPTNAMVLYQAFFKIILFITHSTRHIITQLHTGWVSVTQWTGFCYPLDGFLLPAERASATHWMDFCYPLDGFLLPAGQASATHWMDFCYPLDGLLLHIGRVSASATHRTRLYNGLELFPRQEMYVNHN